MKPTNTPPAAAPTMQPLFQGNTVFCPMCQRYFPESDYLKSVIEKTKTLWIANMVTHYRHTHIVSWNRCWDRYSGHHYRYGWFGDYETEKRLVNERAKRQIVRKCTGFLKFHNITREDFEGLQENEAKTLELIEKKLS
ncbi:MAG: hypothetical protein WC337_02810 [Candidatus Muiribacteriota bacterium]